MFASDLSEETKPYSGRMVVHVVANFSDSG